MPASQSRNANPLEILDLRGNDELGELAQLYHSKVNIWIFIGVYLE